MEWSAKTTENGFKTLLQTVWIVPSIFYLPSFILSYAKTNSTYYLLYVHEKKKRIFHERSKKNHFDLNLSLFPLFRLNTILVTNRWNRSHLSWILSKFLTFMLHTFVLTQICHSPSPMLSRAYFGALKWLQTQINIGEGKITQVFQDLWRGLQFCGCNGWTKKSSSPWDCGKFCCRWFICRTLSSVVRKIPSFLFILRCEWFLIFFLIPNFTMLQTPCHSTHLAGVQVLNNPTKSG